MRYKYIFKLFVFLILSIFNIIWSRINDVNLSTVNKSEFDVTVIGYCLYSDGLGRLPIGFIENFKDKININFIVSRFVPVNAKENFSRVNNIKSIIEGNNKTPGNVSILFDALWKDKSKKFPDIPNSIINIAYSMFESTKIPDEWVSFLNDNFDSVVVPSPFLINVYKKCGVIIPIFLFPHGIYIDDFLDMPIKSKKNHPFVFGCFANFAPHKNQKLLLKSFINKFKNNPNVILRLYGGGNIASCGIYDILNKECPENVEIITNCLSPEEYLKAFSSIDCCVVLSKAEGFSVRPREAIALGIPTILSNNTAHKPLCKTPYFIPVKSNIKEVADYTSIFGDYYGYNFNCSQEDVEKTLEEVYNNYEYYLNRSKQGRYWVNMFKYEYLEKKYLNLVKPDKIILGSKDLITDEYIMTSSKSLYEKYLLIKSFH